MPPESSSPLHATTIRVAKQHVGQFRFIAASSTNHDRAREIWLRWNRVAHFGGSFGGSWTVSARFQKASSADFLQRVLVYIG
jgi:hypothetical protein